MRIIRNNTSMQKVLALYVIATLLFQLYLLATMALNPSQVHSKNWLSNAQGEKVLLCTAEGFKWVDISELIAANDSGDASQHNYHAPLKFSCPLLDVCQLALLIFAVIASVIAQWLARIQPLFHAYRYLRATQRIYLSLAPKQSPPNFIYA